MMNDFITGFLQARFGLLNNSIMENYFFNYLKHNSDTFKEMLSGLAYVLIVLFIEELAGRLLEDIDYGKSKLEMEALLLNSLSNIDVDNQELCVFHDCLLKKDDIGTENSNVDEKIFEILKEYKINVA